MLAHFLQFIQEHQLCEKEDKVLLAVSGGIDSIVMAHLFNAAGFTVGIAHCNFKLRADESDQDEQFVIDLAHSLKIPVFTKSFDTKKYATSHNISTQLAARNLRYDWFEEIMQKKGYLKLATAHHLNDSLETILYNLAKGTGPVGLTGIPVRNGHIIRPLLFTTREEIAHYAQQHAIKWREDQSNATTAYARNAIRHNVLPHLQEINPSLDKTFVRTQRRLHATKDLIEKQAEKFKSKWLKRVGDDVKIAMKALSEENLVIVDEVIKPFGFNFVQVEELLQLIREGAVGKVLYSKNYRLNIDREELIISPTTNEELQDLWLHESDQQLVHPYFVLNAEYQKVDKEFSLTDAAAKLDVEKLKFPLKIRKWKTGDEFVPLGMKGKKKLSDFMIDNKIPLNLKERVCVLETAGKIAWVIGHRLDNRFKVTEKTNRVLSIRLESHD